MAGPRTIKSLRLNVEEAEKGRTWLLLPEGFRDQESGQNYPLPNKLHDLTKMASLYIPPDKKDSGCIYLRRCAKRHKQRVGERQRTIYRIERAEHETKEAAKKHQRTLVELERRAEQAVSEVEAKAGEAIASLNDLFTLGRKGLHGMMKAHLAGEKWQDEKIRAGAFRQCFRMVAQTVKGLGLPSDQKDKARDAILDEAAASLRATHEALAMQRDDPDPPVEH